MPTDLAPAAVLITHLVADFDRWKAGFDDHESARRDAGVVGHHINRAEDDPKNVTVYLALTDVDRARAFSESDSLAAQMRSFGVLAPAELRWMLPVREAIVWDRQLPAFLLHHRVADFDRWAAGYDAAGELQAAKGIVGHAANRSLDDPTVISVYHQAESFDTLRSFLGDPGLRAAMEAAGVTSAPEISFHIGGWAKTYRAASSTTTKKRGEQ
jgi:hypothetical protein